MIRITGRTFQHRDALKNMGARYDGDTKEWYVERLRDVDRAAIKRMVGVLIVEREPTPAPQPRPARPLQAQTIEQVIAEALAKPAQAARGTVSRIHGDDQSWHNHFAEQNPISYFGFSSLNKLVNYLDALPDHRRKGGGWDAGEGWFTGTETIDEAFKLADHGWPEGVEMAQEISEKLASRNALQRRRKYSVAGGTVSIGRMLAHNPAHMYSRPKQPGKKIITLFVEAGMLSSIRKENYIIRAGVIAAIVEILEIHGFSCEIVITDITKWDEKPYSQVVTTVKQAGEPLNINDTVFALGHPSFARRFMFNCIGSDEALKRIWEHMGTTGTVFSKDHAPKQNELFIDRITPKQQRLIDDDAPLITQAMQMWDLIIPKNFPVTINREDD